MNWLSGETLKALSSSAVLLALILTLGTFWIRDRNARLRDLKEQVLLEKEQTKEWREAHRESEKAREIDRENTRLSLESMRTSEAVITGLRDAIDRYRSERDKS